MQIRTHVTSISLWDSPNVLVSRHNAILSPWIEIYSRYFIQKQILNDRFVSNASCCLCVSHKNQYGTVDWEKVWEVGNSLVIASSLLYAFGKVAAPPGYRL